MNEIMGLLPSLAVPGSAIGALTIGIIALLRLRSTDREALSADQRQFIDKLEQARDAADARAERYFTQLDEERTKRIEAEAAWHQAEGRAEALRQRTESLEMRLQQCNPPPSQ